MNWWNKLVEPKGLIKFANSYYVVSDIYWKGYPYVYKSVKKGFLGFWFEDNSTLGSTVPLINEL
jgi:hypothetical protein